VRFSWTLFADLTWKYYKAQWEQTQLFILCFCCNFENLYLILN